MIKEFIPEDIAGIAAGYVDTDVNPPDTNPCGAFSIMIIKKIRVLCRDEKKTGKRKKKIVFTHSVPPPGARARKTDLSTSSWNCVNARVLRTPEPITCTKTNHPKNIYIYIFLFAPKTKSNYFFVFFFTLIFLFITVFFFLFILDQICIACICVSLFSVNLFCFFFFVVVSVFGRLSIRACALG